MAKRDALPSHRPKKIWDADMAIEKIGREALDSFLNRMAPSITKQVEYFVQHTFFTYMSPNMA